ncbi:MAG: ABC transporter permease [Epulopiscium sp. Nele67-Bin004]|nr:MAG: ABC transporter permease [Epulopiscium sp. Nele67-Bin004]
MKEKQVAFLGLIPFIVMIVGFLLGPYLSMIMLSFQETGGGGFTFQQYQDIFNNPYYVQSFTNSITISLYSSSIAIVLCVITAYGITKLPQNMQQLVINLSNITNNFSGVPLAFAFIIMLGNSGIFVLIGKLYDIDFLASFNLYSFNGLLAMYTYFQIPLGIMLLYPTLQGVRDEHKHAASVLGATNTDFWKHVGIPVVLPGVAGVFSILFANSMGAYASTFALVGSNYNLLTIQIGAFITGDVFARTELASAMAVLLSIILIFTLLFNDFMMRKLRKGI